jgi:hypothetical protein
MGGDVGTDAPPAPCVAPGGPPPRVSCIVPTGDRRAVLPLLLEGIQAQTLSAVEVVIVDGGATSSEDLVEGRPGVRYARVPSAMSIGARRNLACELARGEVIVHWDDDDWYAPERLARQVEPILRGEVDVTGLICRHVLALSDRRWWAMSDGLHRRVFVANVHGGTLAFRRTLLGPRVRYPDVSRAEEQGLLSRMLRQGARLLQVDGRDLFAYVRHGRNAWNCEPGRLLGASSWGPGEAPRGLTEGTIARYAEALLPVAPEPPLPKGPAVLRHATVGSTHVDCLGATEMTPLATPAARDRCIAVVASDAMAPFLDGLLRTLTTRGGCERASITVLAAGSPAFAEAVRRTHDVEVLPLRALRAPGPCLKGALYSLAAVVPARQYLLLDADVLVLGEIGPLFDRLDGEPEGSTLLAREGPVDRPRPLAEGLVAVHRATPAEVESLCPDVASRTRTFCVNDGVVLAGREALAGLDCAVRAHPAWVAWGQARRDVRWRQKGVLNLALATAGRAVELDALDNFQLNTDSVQEDRSTGFLRALSSALPVRVLHFNGLGRRLWHRWHRALLREAPPPGGVLVG